MRQEPEILAKLVKRTVAYFNDDLSLKMDEDFSIEEVDHIDYLDTTSLITLSKDMMGTIGMSGSKKTTYTLAKAFLFGESTQEEIEELSEETIAEILNVTMGNIINELEIVKNGGTVEISTPYTMHNSVSITKKKNGKMYLCSLKFDEQTILLSYFI